jgi:hypothetical protein
MKNNKKMTTTPRDEARSAKPQTSIPGQCDDSNCSSDRKYEESPNLAKRRPEAAREL